VNGVAINVAQHDNYYIHGKWLVTMASFSPLRIGLRDPFQMAELHGLHMGVFLATNWDDPPSTQPPTSNR